VAAPAPEDAPRFSGEWKTRFQWDSQELAAIAMAQMGKPVEGAGRTGGLPVVPPRRSSAETPPPPPARPKPAAEKATPPKPPADKPVAEKPVVEKPPTRLPGAAKPTLADKAVAAPPAPPAPRVVAPTVAVAPAAAPATAPATPAPVAPAPARIATARLTGEKAQFALSTPGRFEMGRATSAALRVEHATVSRRHAAITLSDDRSRLFVEDLGAANGTRVNGADIKGTRELSDGDVLELGEVRFTVTLERA